MFRMLLSILLTLSIGFSVGQKEKTITKKKVIMMTTDDDDRVSRDVQVDANVEDDMLELTITIDGEEQEFEVPLDNPKAMESLQKELEEMDVDIHISEMLGHHDDDEDHDFMRGLRWHGQTESGGYLGVQIQGLEGQLADYFGAKDGGVLVTEVIEGSPAEKAGLKAGDVILSVAGEEVEDSGDLVKEIRGHKPESKVELKIIRKNTKRKMRVTLGEAPHAFDMGFGPKNKMMFFGDGHDFDDEDVDVFFNRDHRNPHKMMKKFRFYDDDEDDLDELEDEMDELREELKQLREEIKKLKKDS